MDKKYSIILSAVLLVAAILTMIFFPKFEGDISELTQEGSVGAVYFFDVGQADASMIKTKNEHVVIIDTGSNESETEYILYLKSLGIKKIDAIILSHPHSDHIGGADAVLKNFKVDKVFMTTESVVSPSYDDLLAALRKSDAKVIEAKKGVKFDVDGVSFSFLYPAGFFHDDTNANSAVVEVDLYGRKFLFTGDRENLTSKDIITSLQKIDVLKVGHHGSEGSIRTKAMKILLPQYAVICAGESNDYGHPAKSTLSALSKLKVETLRTDMDGTIVFFVGENKELSVKTSKQRSNAK